MIGSRTGRRVLKAAAPVTVAVAMAFGVGTAAAQDGMAAMAHPGHIHSGTCEDLGDVVFPLTDAQMGAAGMMGGMMGTPEAGMMATPEAGMMGTPEAGMMATPEAGAMDATPTMGMGETQGSEMVATSVTTVDASLDDILGAEHAINFHESEENIQNYIACGEIGGTVAIGAGMDEGGTLVIGLRELNDSGYSGIAVLEGMGDQTEVSVYLAQNLSGMGGGMMDDATPTS
jgi:hypothetical protein